MKKLIFLLLAFLFVTGVMAQNYTEIKASQIPKKCTAFLNKHLGTYTLDRAAKTVENGVTKYAIVAETRGNKAIYMFDKDGNFLGREKKLKGAEKAKPSTAVTPAEKKADVKAAPVKK